MPVDLADAIADLHRIAIVERKTTSTRRLDVLADFCIEQLSQRGITGAHKEMRIPGAGRAKRWDVGWEHQGRPRLGISLKSMLRNIPGTVPNRIDDLIGEVSNVQLQSPEIVVGYLMIFDLDQDAISAKHGTTWFAYLQSALEALSGRSAPHWSTGTVEAALVIGVQLGDWPASARSLPSTNEFFDTIAAEIVARNPSAIDPSS